VPISAVVTSAEIEDGGHARGFVHVTIIDEALQTVTDRRAASVSS
jgi:hypothetical protein